MSKVKILTKLGKVVKENSTTILTASALIGVGTVAVTAFYAGRKTKDKTIKESWQSYIPVGIAVITTGASIIGLNLEHNKKYAALMTAYAASKADNEKLTDKVKEILGLSDEEKSEVANTIKSKEKDDIYGREDIYDVYTGYTFKNTSKIAVLTAVDMVNTTLAEGCEQVRLSEFFTYLVNDAREIPKIADLIVFTPDNPLRIEFGGAVIEDIKTVTTIDYSSHIKFDERVPWE